MYLWKKLFQMQKNQKQSKLNNFNFTDSGYSAL